ncbi:hypothetical protein [Carboxylicivirga sp. M1479]|uniref:hypothetical protein n=1 Tax=Carboxylicivirga sp. M1479 TaxID=2594476 RepID=UPI001177D4FF|nr:hypothetical protein [Carboxylicivirga sp. M1479]TRX65906.1 hypothetical protein FNN09_16065 [Carboxylicivirga sp. M1479]
MKIDIDMFKEVPKDIIISILLSSVIMVFTAVAWNYYRDVIYENLLPYTGWSPDSLYGGIPFVLIFIVQMFMNNGVHFSKFVYYSRAFILMFLVIKLYSGLVDWITSPPELVLSDNPYLKFSPYRPLYTVLMPLVWIVYVGYFMYKDFVSNGRRLFI